MEFWVLKKPWDDSPSCDPKVSIFTMATRVNVSEIENRYLRKKITKPISSLFAAKLNKKIYDALD